MPFAICYNAAMLLEQKMQQLDVAIITQCCVPTSIDHFVLVKELQRCCNNSHSVNYRMSLVLVLMNIH